MFPNSIRQRDSSDKPAGRLGC